MLLSEWLATADEQVGQRLADEIYPTDEYEGDDVNEFDNIGHYFRIHVPGNIRLEVFEGGAIELYGSNAGVNVINLINALTVRGIDLSEHRDAEGST